MEVYLKRERKKNINSINMWLFSRKGNSGFSASSTAEQVTEGIDGSGLTAIVTGASSGIGAETARVLALQGVHVIMAVRNISTGQEAKREIINRIPQAKVDTMELDLSSMTSVRKFASKFNSMGLPLNVLVNNAGVMATPFMLSEDNIELQFATNHVGKYFELRFIAGHFLLTNLLLETMKKTAIETSREGRIVNVSSRRHKFSYPEGIRFDGINDQSRYNSLTAYGQSKLANLLHANEVARRLKDDKVEVTANSVHPGLIATNLFRYNSFVNGLIAALGKHVMKDVQQGAATTCYVALHPDVKGMSGKYYADCNLAEPSLQAKDQELAKKLWDFTHNLIYDNVKYNKNLPMED
ncbi:NAD(P)-binding Rossmann-fold superfamily protein [Striga asiatica]|uniref:NAD(P)-binding Rossmann-fold superfamily protein n=1 Tax=Striga asiatica TaxID=4170 RepID=A0A5A7R016_STRAF|nr:NAD(P)-binding Rossmann-fold superfamily protein [Striga asiatica]